MSGSISPNVVILTCDELRAKEDAAFKRGFDRGTFEARMPKDRRVSQNCANWKPTADPLIGICNSCGAQHQYCEVGRDYKCPHFTDRTHG